jgi:hypothetical protein
MDRFNRFLERGKGKNKNKLTPRVKQSTAVSRENLTGGGAHSNASSPSHPPASIGTTAVERGAISSVTPILSSSAQLPRSELHVEREGWDTGISRPQGLRDTVISKQAHLTCDDVYH